jgi:2-polyprenyl-3-methyl-5-hydroxy-6-metoxy-1,4-benzoquinol methylase
VGEVSDRRVREAESWDRLSAAQSADVAALEQVSATWGSIYDMLLGGLGPLDGLRLLDCGTGLGLLARSAVARGASVVGFDISPDSLKKAKSLAEPGTEPVQYLQAGFEELPFPDATFRAAVGMFVLHHVELGPATRELARVMAPGGTAAFIETWQRNPLLRAARRLRGHCGVAMYGTEDEEPLAPRDIDTVRAAGFDVELEYPGLVFLRLFDNNVLKGRWPGVSRLLAKSDDALSHFKPIKPYGYYCVLRLTRR